MTIRRYLTALPAGYRERALANAAAVAMLTPERSKIDTEAPGPGVALWAAFNWEESGEGRPFWDLVSRIIDWPMELPPFEKMAACHLDPVTGHRPYCPCVHCTRRAEAALMADVMSAREFNPGAAADELAALAAEIADEARTAEIANKIPVRTWEDFRDVVLLKLHEAQTAAETLAES
jgi:hypothetical protein